jgi:hypothetical protein
MAKKIKEQEIQVVKPKIGRKYYYKFAGTMHYGELLRVSKSLSKHYGYPYFWFKNDEDFMYADTKNMTYPVSIYAIFKKRKNV